MAKAEGVSKRSACLDRAETELDKAKKPRTKGLNWQIDMTVKEVTDMDEGGNMNEKLVKKFATAKSASGRCIRDGMQVLEGMEVSTDAGRAARMTLLIRM